MNPERSNDGIEIIAMDTETGNAVAFSVEWSEARDRIATYLTGDTSNPGALHTKAEDILTAMFTGVGR